MCASLYWLMKYLILLLLPQGPHQRFFGINPLWLGRIFISSDITSFLTQGAGSGIASSGNWEGNTKDIGVNVLLTGLALQLATFTFYIVFMWRLVCRVRAVPEASFPEGARKVLTGVWIAAACVQVSNFLSGGGEKIIQLTWKQIQARTIFRMVEFALGIDGYPFRHEWCLYVFESVPMFVALSALAWWHPVKHLQTKRFFEEKPGEEKAGPANHRRGVLQC